MKISVIIPAYNAEATIAKTVQSVLDQQHPADEIIVVNDGSTDSTQKVVHEFGEAVRLINQENQGVSAARNHGIRACENEWVSFLDADDTWEPEKLFEQVALLKQHADLDWCATRYWVCGNPKFLSSYSVDYAAQEGFQHRFNALEAISTNVNVWVSTVLIRKALAENAGLFCKELSSTADNDLWIRVAGISREIGYVNKPLANYRLDADSMSANAARTISKSRYHFFDRLAGHIQNSDPELKSYYERIFDRYVGNYMFNVARSGNVKESRQLARWLKANSYRVPGWRYRWIHWIPGQLITWVRQLRQRS